LIDCAGFNVSTKTTNTVGYLGVTTV